MLDHVFTDAISALLTRLGAHESVLAWEDRRVRREVRATANRLANFDDANMRRSARAAVAASARAACSTVIVVPAFRPILAGGWRAALAETFRGDDRLYLPLPTASNSM